MFEDPSNEEQRSMQDYWDIALRRRWSILLPLFICWAAVWGVSWLLPATYRSDALILVEPPKVPEQYVVRNVTINVQERLQSITQQILSRTRLQSTIDRFHLYPRPNALMALFESGDPVERMRKDIGQIELVQSDRSDRPSELTAFKIHYSAGSPELAQQVNAQLTSLFIDESSRSQQELSQSTTNFLANELATARAKLEEQESKLREFKARHLGDLPSQLETNVQILSGLQGQSQNMQRAMDGARQQKLYLESLLQQYQSVQTGLARGGATPPETLGKHLQELRRRLTEAQSVHTDNYPDVVALKQEIAKTEKLKEQIESELASNQKAAKPTDSLETSIDQGTPSAMMQLQSQLKANQLEIQNYQRDQKTLEEKIAVYQARLNMTPTTEQQMAEISRGYEESKSNYNSLLQKQMQSQLATSLEQRSQNEQFRVIDSASLPTKPIAPNRLIVSLGGLAAGLAIGLGFAALLELTNVRIWREKDLEGIVTARVLVGIPRLTTPLENRRREVVRMMEICGAVAIACLVVFGNLYTFYKG